MRCGLEVWWQYVPKQVAEPRHDANFRAGGHTHTTCVAHNNSIQKHIVANSDKMWLVTLEVMCHRVLLSAILNQGMCYSSYLNLPLQVCTKKAPEDLETISHIANHMQLGM